MIRPFDLRDIRLVNILQGHDNKLDPVSHLLGRSFPLRSALMAYLISGRGCPTLVYSHRQKGLRKQGMGQIRIDGKQARITFLAVAPAEYDSDYDRLVESLVVMAGHHRATAVVAEITDDTLEMTALRRAGFIVYSHKEVWRSELEKEPTEAEPLVLATSSDTFATQSLIINTVPGLVQQVESEPLGRGYVWYDQGDLMAYAAVLRGSKGTLVRFHIHPHVQSETEYIIERALATIGHSSPQVFCCVPRHQNWLITKLSDYGFDPFGSYATLIKHTGVQIRQETTDPNFVEKAVKASSPITHMKKR